MKCNNFVLRLKLLVDDFSTNNLISWNMDGDAIIIHDKDEFSPVVHKFFKAKGYKSFLRQLHLYGFRKTKLYGYPKTVLAYRHDRFQRGQESLLPSVGRTDSKSYSCSSVATQTAPVEPGGSQNTARSEQRLWQVETQLRSLAHSHELLASKFASQQQLILAALQTLNSSGTHGNNQSRGGDVRFNIIVKPDSENSKTLPSITYEQLAVPQTPQQVHIQAQQQQQPVIQLDNKSPHQQHQHNAAIQHQFDCISHGYHNNPNFNFPILLEADPHSSANSSPHEEFSFSYLQQQHEPYSMPVSNVTDTDKNSLMELLDEIRNSPPQTEVD